MSDPQHVVKVDVVERTTSLTVPDQRVVVSHPGPQGPPFDGRMDGRRISSLGEPADPADAATKAYVDAAVAAALGVQRAAG